VLPTITVQSQQVTVVDEFVYLGSLIHSSTQSTRDIMCRRGIIRAAMQRLDNHFWKSFVSIPTKLKLYNTRRIDALDQWCLRTLLGIKWHQFICNEEMRRITRQRNLAAIIQSRRLSIFGHIACVDDGEMARWS